MYRDTVQDTLMVMSCKLFFQVWWFYQEVNNFFFCLAALLNINALNVVLAKEFLYKRVAVPVLVLLNFSINTFFFFLL